ncbi:peptidoglycan-binding protein [Sulfurisoma sediminicola]|uniref:Putative chitinase n=1 Tax=Sulfurisoma sediminicola TaxID=1381557 RepID=A0A497XEF3_9PROT|nr:peptidoglycan-binding protein [Sulfurisoma sediminicola]RLJ65089.1 putative chitinase [Sulfurisoma sediminicola]
MDSAKTRTLLLMRGNAGKEIAALKKTLRKALGKDAADYAGLTAGDEFCADTETALRVWQTRVGLVADGIAGPRTLAVLGVSPAPTFSVRVDAAVVGKLFPYTRTSSIARNLPYVAAALAAFKLTDADMVASALGTIRAETEGFVPIAELPSHFNTLPGQPPFSAYDGRLGNAQPGDGARFRGRGFVQLTGRANYEKYGKVLGIPLADNPDCASAPEVAACLLAAYLDANRAALTKALAKDDLKVARRVVNGGSHGLERFSDTFRAARQALAAVPMVGVAKMAKPGSVAPPEKFPSGRTAPAPAARRASLNVTPDATDLRDRPYQPPPVSLPQLFPEDADIRRFMGAYTQAGLVLDQGQEGACTGFGLACVVNYLRWRGAGMPKKLESVSPRMLYQFARRYDEYEGEDYDGSSCRGALKGWYHNGVCVASRWPYEPGQDSLPLAGWDGDAVERTLGVYYRVEPKAITDLQAAIREVGAIFVSAYTHKGWDAIKPSAKPPAKHADLPVIAYDGRPSRKGGHAFALVGFNRTGFVIQNSWGKDWGAGGFAVIGYADWLAHAMDAWVAALGVPGVVSGRLATGAGMAGTAAMAGTGADWWCEDKAYEHSIVLGNNGHVDRFDTVDGVTRTLQNQACVLPDRWFRENAEEKKRLVLYVHGGLNSEDDAIKRARAMGRYFLGNGCYPLFLVWKSGLLEAFSAILEDKAAERPAGLAGGPLDWITDKLTDPVIEKTIGRPFARPLWSEMKENAELASASGRGGDLLTDALRALAGSWGDKFELHLVGHSAGSIALGRLLGCLAQKDLIASVKSAHLYAPACTVGFANRHYAPHADIMQRLHLDILADDIEQDDNVAFVYRKSLLYFVSNALEADKRMPVLGLANVYDPDYSGWDGAAATAEDLLNWRAAMETHGIAERLTIHPERKIVTRIGHGPDMEERKADASHGGFDNNVEMIDKTLKRITGAAALKLPVDDLVGY